MVKLPEHLEVPATDQGIAGARSGEASAAYARRGVAVMPSALDPHTVARLSDWVEQVTVMEHSPQGPLQHHEQTDTGPVIARTERFADLHDGLGDFLRGPLAALVQQTCGEPVKLFKEKVNHKYPGGGGFAPHQDARAYRFAQRHISVMVPLDPATQRSGCLWFADQNPRGLLEADDRGRIASEVAGHLRWYPVEVGPGDLVVFDSIAPHRSGTNLADHPRRAMYVTYNPSTEGDFRARYYDDKSAEFARSDGTFGGDRVRISISDDFLGRPVRSPGTTSGTGRDR